MEKTPATSRPPTTNLQQNLSLLLKLENNQEHPGGVRVLANFCRHLALSVAGVAQASERALALAEQNEKRVKALTNEVQGFLAEFQQLLAAESPQVATNADAASLPAVTVEPEAPPAPAMSSPELVGKPNAKPERQSLQLAKKGARQ